MIEDMPLFRIYMAVLAIAAVGVLLGALVQHVTQASPMHHVDSPNCGIDALVSYDTFCPDDAQRSI